MLSEPNLAGPEDHPDYWFEFLEPSPDQSPPPKVPPHIRQALTGMRFPVGAADIHHPEINSAIHDQHQLVNTIVFRAPDLLSTLHRLSQEDGQDKSKLDQIATVIAKLVKETGRQEFLVSQERGRLLDGTTLEEVRFDDA